MSKRSTSEFFDSYSQDFDAIYGNQNTPFNRIANQLFRKSMRLRYMRSVEGCQPVEGRTVLDVGCGPGHYSVTLASRGAGRVLGVDFADGMIKLARQKAQEAGVGNKCQFETADFMAYPFGETFDYSLVMGFMDYVSDPRAVIERVLSLTRSKAFFSFPVDGGILAWQRKLRYKSRCDLFMYRRDEIRGLFAAAGSSRFGVEKISRDFFVSVHKS
jgi:2-polyprenyl-3-methyl-5-hydroxy-6-metoxy-1,4-benzoquinol methylase